MTQAQAFFYLIIDSFLFIEGVDVVGHFLVTDEDAVKSVDHTGGTALLVVADGVFVEVEGTACIVDFCNLHYYYCIVALKRTYESALLSLSLIHI